MAQEAGPVRETVTGASLTDGRIVERWLSVNQACEIAGITRRTLYNWMGAGKVEYKRTAGGSRRIRESSLWRDA